MALEEVRHVRLEKIEKMRARGMDPYPAESNRTSDNAAFLASYDQLLEEKTSVTLAGRIMSFRGQGGIAFVDLFDGSARVQILLRKDEFGEEFDFFLSVTDIGDFIEVAGTPFTTNRGMRSLIATSWQMLTKSLRPIPDEWYGLKDEDERYRKRYLDMLIEPSVAALVRQRSTFWNAVRSFMLERGFLEVETPVLETMTGGAEARPFLTHHNALDLDVYLRISVELWHKKLMVAGIPKTFEIGRVFRNEGMSHEHAQDYTHFEFYEAFLDARSGVPMLIDLYRSIAEKTFGTLEFTIGDFEVDLGKEWGTYDFNDLINERYGFDPRDVSLETVRGHLEQERIPYEPGMDIGRGVDLLWKKVRKTIGGPAVLTGMPVYLEPLAKKSRVDPRVVDRFQILIAGSEVGKAFNELNDPVDQRERFDKQQALRDAGDEEAQMADYEYVEAMEYGMPPMFGFGVSERLFSFLAGKSIREAQLFPLMRPREDKRLSKKAAEAEYRSKRFVVISDPSLGYGVTANAIGQLGISIGGFSKQKIFDTKTLTDADGRIHYVDGLYPMANLAGTHADMVTFVMACYDAGIQVFDFSDIMRKAHTDQEMIEGYTKQKTTDIEYLAVGALVPVDFEKEFLGALKLFE